MRRFLLDEKERRLIELLIDDAQPNNPSSWPKGANRPGGPNDVSALLAERLKEPVQVFVQDRVLCDAVPRKAAEPVATGYSDYRKALFAPTLTQILPLENQPRSYKPKDEPHSFSVCVYGERPTETVWMCPPASVLDRVPEDSWQVNRLDIDAARRLDCWYYRHRFHNLRQERQHWHTPLFRDRFTVAEDPTQRKPLQERPAEGALKWLSSAQINERLHAIAHARVRDWGRIGRDDPLKPGDLLLSMLGFTEVKLARYDGPPNDAARSIYLLRASPKSPTSEGDSAAEWFTLTCDDFIDQLRMKLSDRVMKPLTASFLSDDVRLPPLPPGVTIGMAYVLDALTRLGLGGESVTELDANLRRVEKALMADDVPWPGKWSCLRLATRYLNPDAARRKVVVLSSDPEIGPKCVADLKKRRIHDAVSRTFAIALHGLEPSLANEVAQAAAVVSVTSAVAPLTSTSEQLGAAHALDIAGETHMFALYAKQEEGPEFPARQFLEHLFSETDREPASVDLTASGIDALLERVHRVLKNPEAVSCDEVIDRLSKLDSPTEPFMRFAPVASRTSLLDRVRPALTVLSGRLKARRSAPESAAPHITPLPGRREPHVFGKFVTFNDGLAKKLRELTDIYNQALTLIENEALPVVALLIEAETGCGKDALVDYLETLQRTKQFVRFGVMADAQFVLTQLFGNTKGAYTGATTERTGIFGRAEKEKCPVFLNEINSYSPEIQFRLLTVIERGQFSPLGAEENEPSKYCGVVVAATNKPLSGLVAEGDFRLDLQMRLGSPIAIPPLRERSEDIECIFDQITQTLAKIGWTRKITVDPSAWKRLLDYAWPGNARELQGLVMRARLLGKYIIDIGFLEQNFPEIYFGKPRDSAPAADRSVTAVPEELLRLEKVLGTPGLNRKQQYAQLIKHLTGNVPKTNELPDWVRSRGRTIQLFKVELPHANAYLEKLTAGRSR